MLYYVVDGSTHWPYNSSSLQVTPTNVSCTMSDNAGLNAVASGATRPGQVVAGNTTYAVTLPGSFSGMTVTFRL
ncbi:hypothetical protein GGE65_000884 [Skermanella aerolata]|jgi:hypothetical protein|uniref:Uncharacterized protein n=1 Tax=Skermanella aerolata TaxID=393310 RepID=A0A512DMG0_9PROT|nr:hypothetical protein [Skermanella aerolata]KJB96549.1 hypothetical protein N826_32345 [Skermanella aerolata KACC 11604]GEO37664.1 hypothetical protein SAE02_18120 [Skermanella aerolata]